MMEKPKDGMYYKITLQTPVFLYGYTPKAQGIASWLMQESYNIKAYIDIKADEIISQDSIPVISPENIEERIGSEWCVILCLQSITTQKKVADMLLKKGIGRIICALDTEASDYKMSREMLRIYQRVCLKESLLEQPIPKYDAMRTNKKGISILKKFDNYVDILCPIQLVYTGVYSDGLWLIKDMEAYEKNVVKYTDINIALNKLYDSFFEYMLMGKGNCDEYIECFSQMTDKSEEAYFRDRVELFELYEREYRYGIDFFRDTAPMAKWNAKGYFNLQDGHHRVEYLYKKGHLYIPIIISKEDYKIYSNMEKEGELQDFLLLNKISKVNNFEIANRLGDKKLLNFQVNQMILMWKLLFEKGDIFSYSYLDVSDSCGFFAVNMKRLHAGNVSIAVRNIVEEKLLNLIFELTYQENITVIRNEITDFRYDVIFAGELHEKKYLEFLYEKSAKMLFFSFVRNDINFGEIVNGIIFGRYQKLLDYYNDGKWMESGVIIKD